MTPVCEDDGSFTCEDNYTLHLGPVAELALRDGRAQPLVSCTLHPTLYALHPTPYALHPAPYTLHPTTYTLHLTPFTLHPTPHTLHLRDISELALRDGRAQLLMSYTLHSTSYALRPTPYTLHRTKGS